MTLNANALITLADLETELGISSGGDLDRLEQAINEASSTIDDHVGYQVAAQTGVVEKVDGTGTPFLYVKHCPITTITTITYNGTLVADTSYEIHGTGTEAAIYGLAGWIWTAAIQQQVTMTPVGGTERKLYTITYDAGYATIPPPVARAARLLASSYYQTVGVVPGISSESIGRSRISYAPVAFGSSVGIKYTSGMPPQVERLLAPYARVDMA